MPRTTALRPGGSWALSGSPRPSRWPAARVPSTCAPRRRCGRESRMRPGCCWRARRTARLQRPDPAGYFKGESMTRRTAFTVGVQAIGGVAVAAVALPAVGFAVAPLFEEQAEPWQVVGPTSDFGPDSYRPITITAVEDIGETGKSTVYVRQGNPNLTGLPGGYEKESSDEYIAISTR